MVERVEEYKDGERAEERRKNGEGERERERGIIVGSNKHLTRTRNRRKELMMGSGHRKTAFT